MNELQTTSFGIEGLLVARKDRPVPQPHQILVRVEAGALNYLDFLVVEGTFNSQLPLPHVPGTDIAGIVAETGGAVTKWKTGDRVISTFIRNWRTGPAAQHPSFDVTERPSLGRPGLFAEYVLLDADDAVKAPAGWTNAETATLVIAGLLPGTGSNVLNCKQVKHCYCTVRVVCVYMHCNLACYTTHVS